MPGHKYKFLIEVEPRPVRGRETQIQSRLPEDDFFDFSFSLLLVAAILRLSQNLELKHPDTDSLRATPATRSDDTSELGHRPASLADFVQNHKNALPCFLPLPSNSVVLGKVPSENQPPCFALSHTFVYALPGFS